MLDVFCAVTSTRTPPSVNEKVCSASEYEIHDLLKEDKTDSDWSATDRLPAQQAADMIWYFRRVVCTCYQLQK